MKSFVAILPLTAFDMLFSVDPVGQWQTNGHLIYCRDLLSRILRLTVSPFSGLWTASRTISAQATLALSAALTTAISP